MKCMPFSATEAPVVVYFRAGKATGPSGFLRLLVNNNKETACPSLWVMDVMNGRCRAEPQTSA
jgi:hypothetical protein